MVTRITLLRHGRTVANAGGRLQGRVDHPLDDVGRAQAAAALHAIGPVDRVVSSPLQRAVETASGFGDPQIDERWIELDYGDWDDRPLSTVPPEVWARWRSDLDLRPPGGETLRELRMRVESALDDLRSSGDVHVLVVSHVSPIKAAVAWALGVGDEVSWRTRLTTGSYTVVEMGPNGPVLTGFNLVP